jgi:hypothetical protein
MNVDTLADKFLSHIKMSISKDEIRAILLNTFSDERVIGRGATGLVGYVSILGKDYIYKRASYKNGERDQEMEKEIQTLVLLKQYGDPLIHVPKYKYWTEVEYNGEIYTFIMTEVAINFQASRVIDEVNFTMTIGDTFEQLTAISNAGVTSHNDLHTGNVLISMADLDAGYSFDDFRSAFTGMRVVIIDFGRASIRSNYNKFTNPCTDIVSFVMSWIISKYGFLLNSDISLVWPDALDAMRPFYDNEGKLDHPYYYAMAKFCEDTIVNSLGVLRNDISAFYQAIRLLSLEAKQGPKVSSTTPPFFFFQNRHIPYISDMSLLRSDESIENCRKAIHDMFH